MKSSIGKHTVVVKKRKTSITLEDDFWKALREIAELPASMRIESSLIYHPRSGYSFLGSSRNDGTRRLRLLNKSGVGLGSG